MLPPISVLPRVDPSGNVDAACDATGSAQNSTIRERNIILGRFFFEDFFNPFFMSFILVHAVALPFEGIKNLLCGSVVKHVFLTLAPFFFGMKISSTSLKFFGFEEPPFLSA